MPQNWPKREKPFFRGSHSGRRPRGGWDLSSISRLQQNPRSSKSKEWTFPHCSLGVSTFFGNHRHNHFPVFITSTNIASTVHSPTCIFGYLLIANCGYYRHRHRANFQHRWFVAALKIVIGSVSVLEAWRWRIFPKDFTKSVPFILKLEFGMSD